MFRKKSRLSKFFAVFMIFALILAISPVSFAVPPNPNDVKTTSNPDDPENANHYDLGGSVYIWSGSSSGVFGEPDTTYPVVIEATGNNRVPTGYVTSVTTGPDGNLNPLVFKIWDIPTDWDSGGPYKVVVGANKNDNFSIDITPLPTPGIAIVKTASDYELENPGGQVVYTYTVSNTGNVPLSNVGVTDDKVSPVTYVSGDDNSNNLLDLTETWIYTGTGNLTETTTNIATATGEYNQEPVTAMDTVTVTVGEFQANLGIAIDKTANDYELENPGGQVVYTYTVSNTGNVPLSNVGVTDDQVSPVTYVSGDVNTNNLLDLTETWIYTGTDNLTETTTNIAIATGKYNQEPVTARDTVTVTVGEAQPNAGINIDKTANISDLAYSGDPVTYTYTVTNTGNIPLYDVTVTDDHLTVPQEYTGDTNANDALDLTETWVYTATTNLWATTTNIGTATGYYSEGQDPVTDTDEATVTVPTAAPSIAIDKQADRYILPIGGGEVTYFYYVTNTGNVPLYQVSLGDNKLDVSLVHTGDTNSNGLLDLDETWVYSATTTLSKTTTNTATATGEYREAFVSATDVVTVEVSQQQYVASIDIDKTASRTTLPHSGGTVTYTYVVTNTGDYNLFDVTIEDDKLGEIGNRVDNDGEEDSILAVGESWTFEATTTIKKTTTNTAVVTGYYYDNQEYRYPVTDEDTAKVSVRSYNPPTPPEDPEEPIIVTPEEPVVVPAEPVIVPQEPAPAAPALPKTGGNTLAYLLSGSLLAGLGVTLRRFRK